MVTEHVSVVLGHPACGDVLQQPWETNTIPSKAPQKFQLLCPQRQGLDLSFPLETHTASSSASVAKRKIQRCQPSFFLNGYKEVTVYLFKLHVLS